MVENKNIPKNKKNIRTEHDKMNAVLSIDEYRTVSTPAKSVTRKNIKIATKTKKTFTNKEIKKINELELRCSSADEFPLLWDEEGD